MKSERYFGIIVLPTMDFFRRCRKLLRKLTTEVTENTEEKTERKTIFEKIGTSLPPLCALW